MWRPAWQEDKEKKRKDKVEEAREAFKRKLEEKRKQKERAQPARRSAHRWT